MTEPSTQTSEEQPAAAKEDRFSTLSGGLVEALIDRPVTVLSIMLLTVFAGFLAIRSLPIELTPDIARPTITVRTNWFGASPVEIESEIIDKQEEQLQSVQGVDTMESTSQQNYGEIILEFKLETDMDEALVRVANALDQVPSYPENADNPVISTANTGGSPLAVMIVRHNQGLSVSSYTAWIEDRVLPQLERIPGVAYAIAFGGQQDEIHVDFRPDELAARGITVSQLGAAISQELQDRSAGSVDVGKRSIRVRTILKPQELSELRRTIIGAGADGTPISVGDVAAVSLGLRRADATGRFNGKPSSAILLYRESGANVLDVADEIKAVVADLQENEFAPLDLTMSIVSEQSLYIRESLSQVQTNLMLGAGMAILVLLLFLGSLGASVIISLAIPLCALGTAIGMSLLGRTVNVVSLAGVTFAIGMVVDASIVSLENIDTWQKKSPSRRLAALASTLEIRGALLASTATTVVVFVPIIAWQGEIGQILRDIAYAISIAVSLSFLVAVYVIPGLSVWLLRPAKEKKPGPLARFGGWIRSGFVRVVSFISTGMVRPLIIVIVVSVVAGIAADKLLPKFEYLPEGSRNLVFGIMLPPPGYSVEEMRKIGEDLQDDLEPWYAGDEEPAIDRTFYIGRPAQVFSGAVAENPAQIDAMVAVTQQAYSQIPGMIAIVVRASLFGRSIGDARAVEIELRGADLFEVIGLGQQMFGAVRAAIPDAQIRPIPLLDFGSPEYHITPRRDETAAFPLSSNELAMIADTYIDGAIVGEWGADGQRQVDVAIRALDPDSIENPRAGEPDDYMYESIEELQDAPVALSDGSIVPFGVLAEIDTQLGPTVIQRLERVRAITLQVTPPSDLPLERAIEIIEGDVIAQFEEQGRIPSTVDVGVGGTADKLKIARAQFFNILLVALIISFLLLAGLFEDFLAPLVVLIVIPLAALGGVIALRLVDTFLAPQPLDLISAVGFLILIGVVVNNAILIVDGALLRLREGDELSDAITAAVSGRIRPIFMSTTTSLAGLAPMIFVTGSGSELYRGVGAIVLGGLAFSTVLAIFVVPAFFALIWRLRELVARDEATA